MDAITGRLLDGVLNQAIVCAYAIPGFGAEVAAGISILQAIVDGAQSNSASPSTYSLSVAISDLGKRIHDELVAQEAADEMTTISAWMDTTAQVETATADLASFHADRANAGAATFDDDVTTFDKLFDQLIDMPTLVVTPQRLGTYLCARTAYQALCLAHLRSLARAQGSRDPNNDWMSVSDPIRDLYEDSLAKALAFARPLVEAMEDAHTNGRNSAGAAASALRHVFTGPDYAAAFTAELRRIRSDSLLVPTSWERVSDTDLTGYRTFVQTFEMTLASMRSKPLPPKVQPNLPGPAGGQGLGARPPGVLRFMYETSPTGQYVNVVADSTVVGGGLATQNAGTVGQILTGTFAIQLNAAGQLTEADKALTAAYQGGVFIGDPNASPARSGPSTSMLVPLAPGAAPVGASVYAVVYSVGPNLGAAGIVDEAAHRQLYADAFQTIADWNSANIAIANFRVVLLSMDATATPALRAQAAGLVIDAGVVAVTANPQLATLTMLVNTDDTAGGLERVAFDAAARLRGITAVNQGFDVPLS